MITIISGTNRPGSRTRVVAGEVLKIYRSMEVDSQLLDLVDLPPQVFAGSAYADKPEAFTSFSNAVLGSDGIAVVTPEYNGGYPGVLKYFIDMLKFPESFESRPVCFVGVAAGSWGGLRPVEQLQQIFGYRNAYLYPSRVFVSGVMNVIDDGGQLTDDAIRGRLEAQAKGFLRFVRQLKTIDTDSLE